MHASTQIRLDFDRHRVHSPGQVAADNPGMSTRQAPSNPALAAFHPAVAGWFARSFAAPTEAQIAAWPVIRSGRDTLVAAVASAGLDAERARQVLDSGEFAEEVRATEQFFQQLGISGVPAIIIERRHLVSGGQPPEVFERALREIAAARRG